MLYYVLASADLSTNICSFPCPLSPFFPFPPSLKDPFGHTPTLFAHP